MKNMIILVVVISLFSVASLSALDKSIFQDCRVVEQLGNTLVIELDSELTDGSDLSCERAERLVNKITASGYDVVLYPSSNWLPKIAPILAR